VNLKGRRGVCAPVFFLAANGFGAGFAADVANVRKREGLFFGGLPQKRESPLFLCPAGKYFRAQLAHFQAIATILISLE
jgi:hypothetical protein